MIGTLNAREMGAFNAVTGNDYAGGNINRLVEAAISSGYTLEAGWAGFTQWRQVGRTVRRGEHGTACLTVVRVGADEAGNGGTT